MTLDVFADTKYFLTINNKFMGIGPVSPGGDFGYAGAMPIQYYDTYEFETETDSLEITVLVQQDSVVDTDMSLGRGGLMVCGEASLDGGSSECISTDESWLCCLDKRFVAPNVYDYSDDELGWENAVKIESIWNLKKSQIPLLKRTIPKTDFSPVVVKANSECEVCFETDLIYSSYLLLDIIACGEFEITAKMGEVEGDVRQIQEIKGNKSLHHRSIVMTSASICSLLIKNLSDNELTLSKAELEYIRYPEDGENGKFVCSDALINKIYNVGKHSLEICRQSIHLDSPSHQENMGCAGDYYMQSLMEYFCYDDVRLTRFDNMRIADYLKMSDGYMFHTTYSLIWIEMLYEYYMHTADIDTLTYCFDAVDCVLNKMKSCTDETHLIQNPVSYMFIDWTWKGEHNMHHPPKAMGQTPLNAFYYNGLVLASKLAKYLNKDDERYILEAKAVKEAFNKYFYDSEKGLYFDGLNDETKNVSTYMPANIDGRYYSKYGNTLAALYGLCDNGTELLERAIYGSNLDDVQPYFMHFVLDAIYKCGLFEKHGMSEIRRWEAAVEECSKGMKEAWIIFEGYGYDYSHAWGATPTYQLPARISGLKVLEPGMKKISLEPNLFGLEWAEINIPTPYGMIEIKLCENCEPQISVPEGIEVCE